MFVSAFEKALLYYDTRLLPQGWDREELLGSDTEEGEDVDEVGRAVLITGVWSRIKVLSDYKSQIGELLSLLYLIGFKINHAYTADFF